MTHIHMRFSTPTAAWLALCSVAVIASGALASGLEGISYTLTPGAEFTLWDENIGLEDDELLGGRVALNFGRTVSLQGYYFTAPDVRTNLRSFLSELGEPYDADQDIDVAGYGADVVFNIGRGPIVPFVKGGGGIVRFDPDRGPDFKQVGLRAGGGIRFSLFKRVEAMAYLDDAMFRINRYDLVPVGDGDRPAVSDPEANSLRHSVALGLGASIFLGGEDPSRESDLDRAIRSRFARGLRGASIPIEPFVGTLRFDDEEGLNDQDLIGLRAGLDFGEYVGFRAFYWRGMSSDFDATDDVQAWGGEGQFNLNTGPGVVPFIVLGAGALDFLGGFEDPNGMPRSDKTLLILGGGVSVNLSERLHISAIARDYIFSKTDVEETASPDDLLHNGMLAIGLNLSLGGRRGAAAPPDPTDRVDARAAQPAAAPVADAAEENDRAGGTPDAPPPAGDASPGDAPAPPPEAPDGMPSPVRTYQGDRVVTLPVPTVGEIYIRYGDPGGVSIRPDATGEQEAREASPDGASVPPDQEEALRRAIRSAIREELGRPGAAQPDQPGALSSAEQLELLERRLAEQIDRRVENRVRQELAGRPPAQAPSTVVVESPESSTTTRRKGPQRAHAFTGVNLNDPEQLLLGGRLDLGPVSARSPFHFVPEFQLGVFDETSYMATVNVRWDLNGIRIRGTSPYLSTGFGVLAFGDTVEGRDKTEGVLNFSYGFKRRFGKWMGFIEHQGIDIYSLHRLLVGASIEL